MKPGSVFLLPLAFGLFACANNEPKPPVTRDELVTFIESDGSKQFSYTLMMELQQPSGRAPRGGPEGGRGGPPPGGGEGRMAPPPKDKNPGGQGPDPEELRRLTEEGLFAKLEDTGYCRSGYQQWETQVRRGAMNIVGQCNEPASEQDYQYFPNPQPRKVVEERLD